MKENMIQGDPAALMIRFALPMLLGNIFQQLYNVVDTIVVGRFVSYQALAAVGSSFAIMTFINSMIIGLCMGSSILFSQLYGAGKEHQLADTIGTAFCFIMACSIVLSIATFSCTRQIVIWFRLPADTVRYAQQYLQFIFAGLFFTGLYNFCAFLLRSFGDSKSPLLFLIIACLTNIVLDLAFVLLFNWEVFGVALATFIAQALSALLCGLYTLSRLRQMGLNPSTMQFQKKAFYQILNYSILTGIQQSVMNLGILLVQSLVNTFGAITIAAFSAGVKIDSFAYMPVQDFGNAFSTFIAQNHGAGKSDRIRQGVRFAVKAITIFCIPLSAMIVLSAPFLISLFVGRGEPEVIAIGTAYLRTEGIFYLLIGYLFMFYGFFRGIGKPAISFAMTLVSLGIRVAFAYLLAPIVGFSAIAGAIIIGWCVADLISVYFYFRIKRMDISKLPT